MYDMGLTEAYTCLDNIKWVDLNLKSLFRYNIWSMYNSNPFGKNKNKIEDIMPLPWDRPTESHAIATKKEMEEQRNRMKDFEKLLKQGNTTTEKYM